MRRWAATTKAGAKPAKVPVDLASGPPPKATLAQPSNSISAMIQAKEAAIKEKAAAKAKAARAEGGQDASGASDSDPSD